MVPMRTTLKRGVGRGAALNGNGRVAVRLRLSRRSRSTSSRPARREAAASLALRILGWAVLVLAVLVGGTAGGAYLYLHESVAAVAPKSVEVKKALKSLDVPLPGQPATALVIGYDRRANEAKGTPSRSDTLMLVRADPGEKTISMLSFPRDLRAEIHCPGRAVVRRQDQRRLLGLRRRQGSLETVRAPHGRADQLHRHGQLPRLPAARRPARRRLDGRRPPLLQRPRRTDGLREDQPPARLPAPERDEGARLRPVPAHRLRPLPQRAPAAVRPRLQGPDRVGVLDHAAARSSSRSSRRTSRWGRAAARTSRAKTVLSYGALAYSLPPGHVFQTRIDGLEGFSDLTTSQENIDKRRPRVPEPGRRVAA